MTYTTPLCTYYCVSKQLILSWLAITILASWLTSQTDSLLFQMSSALLHVETKTPDSQCLLRSVRQDQPQRPPLRPRTRQNATVSRPLVGGLPTSTALSRPRLVWVEAVTAVFFVLCTSAAWYAVCKPAIRLPLAAIERFLSGGFRYVLTRSVGGP